MVYGGRYSLQVNQETRSQQKKLEFTLVFRFPHFN
jgi:hypothetical protein